MSFLSMVNNRSIIYHSKSPSSFIIMEALIYLVFLVAILGFIGLFKKVNKRRKLVDSLVTTGRRNSNDRLLAWHGSRIRKIPYDDKTIGWCANLLKVNQDELKNILTDVRAQYITFGLYKRTGGYRTINAPKPQLRAIQQTIYRNILSSVNIHPAATGFRKNTTIVDNANLHLGKEYVFKTDIKDFFGAIKRRRVKKVFLAIGYPNPIAALLSDLCCLNHKLPQGSPASPVLSNIAAYEMDVKLAALAKEYNMVYSRYADDLVFSTDQSFSQKEFLLRIAQIMVEEKFELNMQKTRFWNNRHRKIVTGISISSGKKLTIPKKKKREVRQNVHYILTKGLAEHKKHIGSTDPAYLKRLTGYLNFWAMVEPDNAYVKDAIRKLKRIRDN